MRIDLESAIVLVTAMMTINCFCHLVSTFMEARRHSDIVALRRSVEHLWRRIDRLTESLEYDDLA